MFSPTVSSKIPASTKSLMRRNVVLEDSMDGLKPNSDGRNSSCSRANRTLVSASRGSPRDLMSDVSTISAGGARPEIDSVQVGRVQSGFRQALL